MIHSFSKLFFYHNKYHTLKNDYKICFSMKRKRWNSTSTKNSINDNLSNNEESLIKDSSKNNLTSEVKEKKKDSSDFNDKELKSNIFYILFNFFLNLKKMLLKNKNLIS